MFRDAVNLGMDAKTDQYDGKYMSDMTGALLTSDATLGLYSGINTDGPINAETAEMSVSKYYDAETDGSHSKPMVEAANGLSSNLEVRAVLEGHVVTDMDAATCSASFSQNSFARMNQAAFRGWF